MKTCLLFIVCLFLVSRAQGGGREVLVAVGWQGSIRGELVAVGDTSLIIAVVEASSSREAYGSEDLRVVPLRNVRWVVVKAVDNHYLASALGMVGGAVLGGILGGSNVDDADQPHMFISNEVNGVLEGAGIGALMGLGIGFGVGYALSSKEMRFSSDEYDFKERLRQVARNPLKTEYTGLTRQ